MTDARRFAPAAARNRDPIADAFLALVGREGRVLEIASGSGEHAVHLCSQAPGLIWTPSDPDPDARASIAAWRAHAGLSNLGAPLALDVAAPDWTDGLGGFDALVSINMIHIAPFEAAEGLFAGAAQLLPPGGALFLYGPFRRHGAHTAASNDAFDQSLKARNPRWGVRDLEGEVIPLAAREGFDFAAEQAMPANNFVVVFRRRDTGS